MASFVLLFIGGSGVIALVIVVLMRCILLVVTVENRSMAPTLEAGDRVLMIRHWPTRWLRKGQIVLIEPGRGAGGPTLFAVMPYIKRIAALGGETLTISLTEIAACNYSFNHKINHEQSQQVWHIPAGHLFVQGDSPQSVDSRTWGPLPLQSVLGVMLMKLPHKAGVHPTQQMPSIGLSVKQAAPPFTAQTLSGETVTLVNFSGRATLFLFLTPRAISTYAAQAAQLTAAGVALVVVSVAAPEVTRAWTGQLPSSIPILVAPRTSNPLLDDYHIFATPAFCLVNEHSKVEAAGLIGPNMEAWKTQIGSLIGQQLTVPEDGSVEP